MSNWGVDKVINQRKIWHTEWDYSKVSLLDDNCIRQIKVTFTEKDQFYQTEIGIVTSNVEILMLGIYIMRVVDFFNLIIGNKWQFNRVICK